MSGPIIRKYGFPNFDSIFGKKEPQHGVEDPAAPASVPHESEATKPGGAPGSKPEPQSKPEPGKS